MIVNMELNEMRTTVKNHVFIMFDVTGEQIMYGALTLSLLLSVCADG